jgi:hypothetical protein
MGHHFEPSIKITEVCAANYLAMVTVAAALQWL